MPKKTSSEEDDIAPEYDFRNSLPNPYYYMFKDATAVYVNGVLTPVKWGNSRPGKSVPKSISSGPKKASNEEGTRKKRIATASTKRAAFSSNATSKATTLYWRQNPYYEQLKDATHIYVNGVLTPVPLKITPGAKRLQEMQNGEQPKVAGKLSSSSTMRATLVKRKRAN